MVTRKMLKLCYFNTSSVVKPAISTFCCLESSSFTRIISPHRPCCVGLFPECWHLQHLKLEKEFCLIIASNFFCCRVMYSLYRSQPCVLRAPISLQTFGRGLCHVALLLQVPQELPRQAQAASQPYNGTARNLTLFFF